MSAVLSPRMTSPKDQNDQTESKGDDPVEYQIRVAPHVKRQVKDISAPLGRLGTEPSFAVSLGGIDAEAYQAENKNAEYYKHDCYCLQNVFHVLFLIYLEKTGSFTPTFKNDLLSELKDLEEGGIFASLGIRNFLEADYFGWYLDTFSVTIQYQNALGQTNSCSAGAFDASVGFTSVSGEDFQC